MTLGFNSWEFETRFTKQNQEICVATVEVHLLNLKSFRKLFIIKTAIRRLAQSVPNIKTLELELHKDKLSP